MFRELRPVGEAISIGIGGLDFERELNRYFPDPLVFYQSGTAALAAALLACKAARRIDRPEVLLPAYSCPDLLSAVNYAGLHPVLVDLERCAPWMSIPDLASKVNGNTVAVIAVNFLGIPERLTDIRRITDERKIFLIEDCAQGMPEKSRQTQSGDLTVLSFGKGKPVALLHGGALMIRRHELGRYIVRPVEAGVYGGIHRIRQYLKMAIYNFLIRPRCYWILKYLPMLRLGETSYKPLETIESMSSSCRAILKRNIEEYLARQSMASEIHKMLGRFAGKGIMDLPARTGEIGKRMLRYPLLMGSRSERDACFQLLKARGLGGSIMYPGILPSIKGVELSCAPEEYPNADEFAGRLLTLPLHSDVSADAVSAIEAVFRQCLVQRQ